MFFASIISIGFGIGLMVLSVPKFDVVKFGNRDYYITEEETVNMDNNVFFINNVNYVESDNNDLKIEYTYMKNSELVKERINNGYSIYSKINR